ncbi:MAG: hypothetical protein ACP5OG_06090 [Candidatus Nanoarchaeia archaeon]
MSPKQPLNPRKIVNVKGKVHYSERSPAWNLIKLKTEFINKFPKSNNTPAKPLDK